MHCALPVIARAVQCPLDEGRHGLDTHEWEPAHSATTCLEPCRLHLRAESARSLWISELRASRLAPSLYLLNAV